VIGQTLGHYRIVEKIAEGGMGVVYRARDERLGRDVALKLLPVEKLANLSAMKSFREEAQALSKLNHPNIATIHDFDAQDGLNFLVMEYVQGVTLDGKIAAGPLPEKEVVRLGTQLAQGLQAAHSKGVIHRDLKPSNLAVTTDRCLKILDFGLARFSEGASQNTTLTSVDAHPAGTLPYMAPELLQGQPADERSDIYAAGAVLYEMTTGQRLFPHKHGAHLLDAILHRSVRPPRELNPRLSLELQNIIQKAIDKDPDRRYQSAKELKIDLQRLPLLPKPAQPVVDQEPTGSPALEIAHVLFMEIVGYSEFPMDQQKRLVEELQKTVRGTPEFARAKSRDNLISLPSGDGMALVFFSDPESPCRCSLQVNRVLRSHPDLRLRMGIHTGLVYRTEDINTSLNVGGGGINLAQRVMDCGDAGHILVSKTVAEMLLQVSTWSGSFHDLGEAEVEHGVRVHLYNLYTDDAGNPKAPSKLCANRTAHKAESGKIAGSSSRRRSGIETPSLIREQSALAEPQATKTPQPAAERPGLLEKLCTATRRKLRLAALAVLMLAVLAYVLPLQFHKAKAAPPGVPPLAAGKYLAVLPFVVEGDPTTLQPVADGLNQQLSAKLLALRDVYVQSARAAEDVDPRSSLATIGGSLGVNLVIRGTLQGDDKTIRVSMSLDEITSGRRRLNQRFSGMRSDLLKLEDQIYRRILQVLELNPSGEETVRVTDDPEAYELYNKGLSAYRGHPDVNQVQTAIGFYELATQKDSNFALAHAGLADACRWMYHETRDTTWIHRAMGEAALAQGLNENLKEAHLAMGDVYQETGKTEDAFKEFRRALQISPNCDACYRHLGRAYVDVGNKSQAIISLQNAVTINPYYWSNQNELGIAYLQFGKFDKALATFLRVLEVEPTNPIIHENIGDVFFFKGRYNESIAEYEKAIALQSSSADVYSNLGEALLYLKRYPEALQALEKAAKMKPGDQTLIGNLADGYRWAGQQKKAVETYDRAITLATKDLDVNPRDATALGSLGLCYAKKGETSLAQHYIHSARAIDPSDMQLAYNEAVVRTLARQPELALKSLRTAFEKGVSPEQAMLDPEFSEIQNNPAFKKLVDEFLERQKQTD